MTRAPSRIQGAKGISLALNVILTIVLALTWPGTQYLHPRAGLMGLILCLTIFLIVLWFIASPADAAGKRGMRLRLGMNLLRLFLAFWAFAEWPGGEDGTGLLFAFLGLPIVWLLFLISTQQLVPKHVFIGMLGSTLFIFLGYLIAIVWQPEIRHFLLLPASVFNLVSRHYFTANVTRSMWEEHLWNVLAWAWWASVVFFFLKLFQRLKKRLHLTDQGVVGPGPA